MDAGVSAQFLHGRRGLAAENGVVRASAVGIEGVLEYLDAHGAPPPETGGRVTIPAGVNELAGSGTEGALEFLREAFGGPPTGAAVRAMMLGG